MDLRIGLIIILASIEWSVVIREIWQTVRGVSGDSRHGSSRNQMTRYHSGQVRLAIGVYSRIDYI
jgi:hypothetical protein